MMLDVMLVAAGGLALVLGTLFAHLERWSISPPLLGLLTGVALGPTFLHVVSVPPDEQVEVLHLAARLLLAVALMAIALRYPLPQVRRRVREVTVLILVVLPTMAGIVALGAIWTLQLPVGVALVLGAALSPTDPVLASGIVTGEPAQQDIPARGRQSLTLESGVNDGLALPLVLLAVAWALERPFGPELGTAAYEVVGAATLGALVGAGSGRALRWAERHRELGPAVRSLYTIVLAVFVLGLSGLLHVEGLLGILVAGLVHNHLVTSDDRESEVAVDETLNQFLVLPVFVLFGAVLPWSDWAALGWDGVAFVAIALFLRRLPVALALTRPLAATWAHTAWLGWFGPIGVAALFYLAHAEQQGITHPVLWSAGTLVIATSTIAHGLTAGPARVAYRRWSARAARSHPRSPGRTTLR